MTSRPYRNNAAFRTGIERGVKAEAAARGVPADHIRRQFILQRFLARVFNEPPTDWVLKGGTSLIVRNPSARYSKDIDLHYAAVDQETKVAVEDLRRLANTSLAGDLFTFTVGDPQRGGGQDPDHTLAKLKVVAYIGAREYGGNFPIDLSLNQRVAEPIDLVRPYPVLELPGSEPLPLFALYPLSEQVADKLCAMYSTYSGAPSSRYRDLVDLTFIVTSHQLDAARTLDALRGEANRRMLTLPTLLASPGPLWAEGYRVTAAQTSLPADLRPLDAALALVNECVGPLLGGERTTGVWDPHRLRWNERPAR